MLRPSRVLYAATLRVYAALPKVMVYPDTHERYIDNDTLLRFHIFWLVWMLFQPSLPF